MDNIYNKNGLLFWTQQDIKLRQRFVSHILSELQSELRNINHSFQFEECEASILTPTELVNKNYTDEDVFRIDDMTLRPETTMGSYAYAQHILNPHYKPKTRLPLVIRQHGKSFRREQDKVQKNMRLKEFYQLEFQIIYSNTTADGYYTKIVGIVHKIIGKLIGECYTIPSDRLPDYSEITTDIQMNRNDMEVCSISQRKDFPWAKVTEVAIGTDRLLYNFRNMPC